MVSTEAHQRPQGAAYLCTGQECLWSRASCRARSKLWCLASRHSCILKTILLKVDCFHTELQEFTLKESTFWLCYLIVTFLGVAAGFISLKLPEFPVKRSRGNPANNVAWNSLAMPGVLDLTGLFLFFLCFSLPVYPFPKLVCPWVFSSSCSSLTSHFSAIVRNLDTLYKETPEAPLKPNESLAILLTVAWCTAVSKWYCVFSCGEKLCLLVSAHPAAVKA